MNTDNKFTRVAHFINNESNLNENESTLLVLLIMMSLNSNHPVDVENDKTIINSVIESYEKTAVEEGIDADEIKNFIDVHSFIRDPIKMSDLKAKHHSGYSNLKFIALYIQENIASMVNEMMAGEQ